MENSKTSIKRTPAIVKLEQEYNDLKRQEEHLPKRIASLTELLGLIEVKFSEVAEICTFLKKYTKNLINFEAKHFDQPIFDKQSIDSFFELHTAKITAVVATEVAKWQDYLEKVKHRKSEVKLEL